MSDLISRNAAIDAIEQMQMPIMWSEFPEEQFVFTGMSEALHAIKELPSAQPEPSQVARDIATIIENEQDMRVIERNAQQWIPCSERLPDEYGEYLITWETSKAPTRFIGFAEGEETGVWDDQHDRFVFSWLPEDYIIERYPDWRVIAWMPLPEPYKEE